MTEAKNLLACTLILIVAAFAGGASAAADRFSESHRTLSPYFSVEGSDTILERFPLQRTKVAASISAVIADVRVEQVYRNEGEIPINARYIFPASTRAAVHGMTMRMGDKRIRAVIKEKEEAQKAFEEARGAGKSASLLHQRRPNVFSMQVANILPGDEISIELHYSEFLAPAEGGYSFVFPAVVGPRHSEIPEHCADADDAWIKSPYLPQGAPSKSKFSFSLEIGAAMPIQEIRSPSHRISIDWKSAADADVNLVGHAANRADRDIIIDYRLSGRKITSGLLLHRGEKENFFALMMEPPERFSPDAVPAREYIFVTDVSGSMNGFPLDTAKLILKDLIGGMREADRFNLVLFAGAARKMAETPVPAAPYWTRRAVSMLEREKGGGGTRLAKALKEAMAPPADDSLSRSVVVVTDGYIAAEADVFHLIAENLENANVFSFGIGSSVNRYLIEGMARAGQGEPFVVTKPGEARAAAARFRQYVEVPLLTNIELSYEGFDVYDVEPGGIPDLFASRPLVVFGKWRGEPKGRIRLSGTCGSGAYRSVLEVSGFGAAQEKPALGYLWARRRVEGLCGYGRSRPKAWNREEITFLGLTYSLMTPYTSFVAVDERIKNRGEQAGDVDQPLFLPQGVSQLAVGGSIARVPEPALWQLGLIGAAALLVCRNVCRGIVRMVKKGGRNA